MQTELSIRTATVDDCNAIGPLLRELDDYHVRILPSVFQSLDDPRLQRDRIAKFLDAKDAQLFVAECGAEIDGQSGLVGLATVRIIDSPDAPMFRRDRRACIDDLVVRSDCRGQGIAKRLLARVSQWARSRRLQCIDINVWDENKVGTSFFKSNGFQPRSHRMELRVDEEP